MNSQAIDYLAGGSLDYCPVLEELIAQYQFGSVDETCVEATHARLERKVGNVHNRSEAYDSIVLRLDYFRQLLKRDSQCRELVNDFLRTARTPRLMLQCLGFGNHPVVQELIQDKISGWHPDHRKVVYKADMHSLYHQDRLSIEMQDGDVPTDQPAAPYGGEADGTTYDRLLHFAAIEIILMHLGDDEEKQGNACIS